MAMLVCHPGRHGDLLWSLPTIRAIAQANPGLAIDLAVPAKYGSLRELLMRQSYLRKVLVVSEADWPIVESAPITPRQPFPLPGAPGGYSQVLTLGYAGWPSASLPVQAYQQTLRSYPDVVMAPLDLDTPWITPPAWKNLPQCDLAVGFTDEWFELKYGLYWLLHQHYAWSPDRPNPLVLVGDGNPRWRTEAGTAGLDWSASAAFIAHSRIFVGCCSALHVLACALGKPCVIVEPAEARHHDIFYPYGKIGRVQLVLGGDGKPTFDARHLCEAIDACLVAHPAPTPQPASELSV